MPGKNLWSEGVSESCEWRPFPFHLRRTTQPFLTIPKQNPPIQIYGSLKNWGFMSMRMSEPANSSSLQEAEAATSGMPLYPPMDLLLPDQSTKTKFLFIFYLTLCF